MKVGILSMQRIRNYGSFLQAYSLKRNLELLGNDVEFVDYKVEPPLNVKQGVMQKRSLKHIVSAFRRRVYKTKAEKMSISRQRFLERYDPEFYDMLGLTREKNYTPKLDALVIGSDEVFNCLQTNKDVGYSKQLFGAENNAERVITYAASFGNTTLERMDEYGITDEVGELLKCINAFSVRDNNTKSIVEKIVDKSAIIHLDPVFIYDYPEINDIKVDIHDYIVLYAYTNRIKPDEAKAIKAFARKYHKKLVCIGEYQTFCDEYISANPFELLAYIKHADYIITDTFHGTVFSIKFNKTFATILRSSVNGVYGNVEKLGYLLKKFNLYNRRIEDVNCLENTLLASVDFSYANMVIDQEKTHSIEYLEKNIKG